MKNKESSRNSSANLDLAVRCAGGKISVLLDQKEFLFVEEGVNIVVYDRVAGRMIDGVGFDENHQMEVVR